MNSSSEISVRLAKEGDARAIAAIHVASWQENFMSVWVSLTQTTSKQINMIKMLF